MKSPANSGQRKRGRNHNCNSFMVHDITRISDRHCRVVVALPVSPVISRVWPMDSPEIGRGDCVGEAAAIVFAGVMTTLKEFFLSNKVCSLWSGRFCFNRISLGEICVNMKTLSFSKIGNEALCVEQTLLKKMIPLLRFKSYCTRW